MITKEIGDIPNDISYDSDECDTRNNESDDGAVDNSRMSGQGVLDYDINDLIGDDDDN